MWEEKHLHGQQPLRVNNADVGQTKGQQWLDGSELKAKTQGFIAATQDQILLTRDYQVTVMENETDPR